MSLNEGRYIAAVVAAGAAAGAVAGAAILYAGLKLSKNDRDQDDDHPRPVLKQSRQSELGHLPNAASGVLSDGQANDPHSGPVLHVENQRSIQTGMVARWTRPVVISTPGYEDLATALSKRLGCVEFPGEEGPTLSLEKFKSNDPNIRFNWQRVVGRKIIFLFDTVDQSRLMEQLALLQALQGFAVPDASDTGSKWKTYHAAGKYSWGRASHITIVLPWYRPCQMERTSRWHLKDGKWDNGNPEGQWLDVPIAQYMARLLSTPGSVPPRPGPSDSLDGMPLKPLWRPPLELLFIELHEEAPIRHCIKDLGATIRMERFVPYFLDKFKSAPTYAGAAHTYVVFPDHGAYDRYRESVTQRLKLDTEHILYINKTRVGDSIEQVQKLFFHIEDGSIGTKESFVGSDHILIVDDFTNSGSTLFGAVNLVNKMVKDGNKPTITIYVSHLIAGYDPKVVSGIVAKIKELGPQCRFCTTNTIPMTTDILKNVDPQNPQIKVYDVSDYIADIIS